MTTLSLLLFATTVTVSPGDDLQATIAKAHGGRVVLRPGTYPLERTIEIGAVDAGLTIAAQRPGTARLLGGRVLQGWRAADDSRLDPAARPHVLVRDVSDLPDLGTMTRAGFAIGREKAGLELFFDAKPMTLARWPNEGWLRTGPGTSGQKVVYAGSRHWDPKEDVWAMGYWKFDWAETYERVVSPDEKGFGLAAAPPFGTDAGRRFFFLNALEELDSPGEWYLDRGAKRLYLWPPAKGAPHPRPLSPGGERGAESDRVRGPRFGARAQVHPAATGSSSFSERDGVGIDLGGEAVASTLDGPMFHLRDAAGVTLEGLDLEVGRADAIRIEGGERDTVRDCLIRDFGTDGVTIVDAKGSGVVGCDLTGLGGRGIVLDGGDRRPLARGDLYADDTHVWAYSRWERTYRPAVAVNGVGNRVSRCLMEDAPHNAVLLSGNDHLLEGNDVRRVCQETGDSGAFYMGRNPTMRGTVIRGNRFRELGAKVTTEGNFTEVMSVYLDDGWPATLIEGNVFEGPGTGVMVGGGGDNRVLGNAFVGKSPAVHVDARGRGWAKGQILNPKEWDFLGKLREVDATGPLYAGRYPALRAEIADGFRDPVGTRVEGNVAVGGVWLRLQDGLSSGFAGSSNVLLASGGLSDALRRLARPIDLAQIGLRTPKGRPIDLAR